MRRVRPRRPFPARTCFDASARPRQSPPGGGLGGRRLPLAPPRSTCVPRSSHRGDRAAHRDAASEVVPRATRETRTSANATPAGFSRPFASQEDVRNSQIGAVSARGVLFGIFSLTSNSSRRLPLSRASQSTTSAASPRNTAPGKPVYRSVITITARTPEATAEAARPELRALSCSAFLVFFMQAGCVMLSAVPALRT